MSYKLLQTTQDNKFVRNTKTKDSLLVISDFPSVTFWIKMSEMSLERRLYPTSSSEHRLSGLHSFDDNCGM